MFNEFRLEVSNTCAALGLLEGDEVIYSPQITPRSNGKDLAVMEIKGELVVAAFTKFGAQYLIMGDNIQVFRQQQVRIIGKVIDGTHVETAKAHCVNSGLAIDQNQK